LSIWTDLIWRDEEIVAHDLETSGQDPKFALQPWRVKAGTAWITSASAVRCLPGRGLVRHLSQLFPTRAQLKQFLEDAIANGWTLLGWNIAFDISMLMALGDDIADLCMRVKWLDGMLMWRHYDIEPEYEFQTAKHLKRSYSLKGYTDSSGRFFPGAMQEWLPHVPAYNEDVDFHATDDASLKRLQTYNDDDNAHTFVIARMIWAKLTDRQRRAVLIQAECLPVVAQGNLLGLPVDRLTVRHLQAKLADDAAAYLAQLAPDGMTEKIVRSPAQLAELMFDKWGLPVLKENKSKDPLKPNTRSTDKEVLHELAFIDPRAKLIKSYRETLNAQGKFCHSVLESLDYNGDMRTHPIGRLFGTYTDRMTVASQQGKGAEAVQIGFALHQMKREAEFREFITVEEGCDIVEFDAAGQEFRWMAIAANDPTMLHLCQPGEDAHSYMGAAIVGIDYKQLVVDFHAGNKTASDNRYLGKFANLSLQYRTSARKLRSKARVDYNIPLEMPAAYRIHATYQREYPGVPVYWDHQIALVKGLGYVETFGGNRIKVVGDWHGTWGWSMGSTAINARIQGTGADQKHLAIAVIKDYLREIRGRFLFDLHDGLYLAIPSAIRPKAVDVMKRMLDNLPYQQAWGFTPPIPMPWDAKVGIAGTPSCAWGRLKEVKFSWI
jgi:DNA polymerase I-like protein with 3'-5' exonuclease and polymerase domains